MSAHVGPRRTVLAAGAALAVLFALPGSLPALAAPPPGTRTLASGPSGIPARIDVLGADSHRIVFANEDQGGQGVGFYVDSYGTVAVGGGQAAPLAGGSSDGIVGGSVAGTTLVYFGEFGQPHWVDLETGRSGPGRDSTVDPSWETAVPGGGAWVDIVGGTETLLSTTTAAPNATPTVLATLPGLGVTARAAAADTHGIAAVAGTALDYYSLATGTVRRLNTAGAFAAGFSCTSATATAIGCFDATTVLRVPTDGSAPTLVPAAGASDVVVGPTATAWTTGRSVDGEPLTVLPVGSGHATRTGFRVSGVAATGDGFAYSRFGLGTAGVYRLDPSGSPTTRLLGRAPALPRVTFRIALTAGRVAWTDDSTVAYPARSRRLARSAGSLRPGPTAITAPATAHYPLSSGIGIDEPASGLAVSGSRSVFTGPGRLTDGLIVGPVVLVDSGGRHLLAPAGNGDVAISGARVLWATPRRHVMVRDLATGRTRDLTAITGRDLLGNGGDLGTTLYGRYLAYQRGGYAWRLDLASGRSVRVERSNSGVGVGQVLTAGDWVLSQVGHGRTTRLLYRNARTMGPVQSVGVGRYPAGVSQAGFVSGTFSGRVVFRGWGATTDRALPPAGASVRADGGLMAWIGADGYPKIAPFPASAARPQALGAPLAASRVRAGRTWTIDQPTSQVLDGCLIVIRNDRAEVVARLSCAAAFTAEGEAVARWRVGTATPGRYTWQLLAGNAVGPVLSATGTPGTPVSGTVVVQP